MSEQEGQSTQPLETVAQGVGRKGGEYVYTVHISPDEAASEALWGDAWRRGASAAGWVPIGPPVLENVRLPSGDGLGFPDDPLRVWAVSGAIRRPEGTSYYFMEVPEESVSAETWRDEWDGRLAADGYVPAGLPVLRFDNTIPAWRVEGSVLAAGWPDPEEGSSANPAAD